MPVAVEVERLLHHLGNLAANLQFFNSMTNAFLC